MNFKPFFLLSLIACLLFSSEKTDTLLSATGKFIRTNEDYDYWYFFIAVPNSDTLRFIYDSEELLVKKKIFQGKSVKVTYKNIDVEDAGSGQKVPEKYLVCVDTVCVVKNKK